MKAPLLSLFLAGATLSAFPLQIARADDSGTQAASNGSSTDLSGGDDTTAAQGGAATGGEKRGKWREAFAQLGLSDAQKEQIKQIRASTSPGRERRQQIMGVLTPDQKEKLRQLIQNYRAQQGT